MEESHVLLIDKDGVISTKMVEFIGIIKRNTPQFEDSFLKVQSCKIYDRFNTNSKHRNFCIHFCFSF